MPGMSVKRLVLDAGQRIRNAVSTGLDEMTLEVEVEVGAAPTAP